jgi:hypothetical protein
MDEDVRDGRRGGRAGGFWIWTPPETGGVLSFVILSLALVWWRKIDARAERLLGCQGPVEGTVC